MDLIQTLDTWFFLLINNFAGQWLWLDATARLFLNDYFVPSLMAVILLMLWFEGDATPRRIINQQAVLAGTLSAILANIVLKIMNLLFHRPRPFDVVDVTMLFYRPTDSSFPSNAAALGFSIAVGVWFQRQKWGWLLLIIAAIFAVSRVFGGVHYPLDIIAGATLGCVSAWVIHRQKWLIDRTLGLILVVCQKIGLP